MRGINFNVDIYNIFTMIELIFHKSVEDLIFFISILLWRHRPSTMT